MSDSDISSKRFNGTYGYAIATLIILAVATIDIISDKKLSEISSYLIQVLLFTSAGLLGFGQAIEGIKNKLSK